MSLLKADSSLKNLLESAALHTASDATHPEVGLSLVLISTDRRWKWHCGCFMLTEPEIPSGQQPRDNRGALKDPYVLRD